MSVDHLSSVVSNRPHPADAEVGTWFPCRRVRSGTVTIALDASVIEARDRFDALFAAMPDGDDHGGEGSTADVRVVLAQAKRPGALGALYELWLDGERVLPHSWMCACEDRLLTWVNNWALDSEPGRLHLHAGLVSKDGAGVLFVAPSGSGKSTLVAHLVRSGWVYHSDEMVGFDPARPLVGHSFPRPPTLKPGAWPLFADLPSVSDDEYLRFAADRLHIPPGELGPLPTADRAEVRAVVFVSQGPTHDLRPVGPSRAIELCVADTLDLGRIGVAGMRALVRLVSGTHLFQLQISGLDGADALLSALPVLAPLENAKPAWELLPAAPDQRASDGTRSPAVPIGPDTPLWRADRTASWAVSDGAVIYDPEPGTVARLDPSAGEVWRRLDGRTAADLALELGAGVSPPETTQDILGVVRDLMAAGLVEAATGQPT